MAGNKVGGSKMRATMLAKFNGDEEALRKFYSNIGRKGGRASNTGGFASNPALAKVAGKKGGSRSRRGSKLLSVSDKYYTFQDKFTGNIYKERVKNV